MMRPAAPDTTGLADLSPIFVVGHPRSGTTLLASILGRHPDVASTPESQYLDQVRYDLDLTSGPDPSALIAQIKNSPSTHLILDQDSLSAQLSSCVSAEGAWSERDVFAALLEHYRQHRGTDRILEKSPLHLRSLPTLQSWFPKARFVWIQRDGRACITSLKKVGWASHDTAKLSRQWVRNMAFGLHGQRHVGPALATLRFEDLITDPQTAMAPICDHLGLSLDDRMFDHQAQVDTVKPSEREWKANVAKPIMRSRAESWKTELSQADLERSTGIMGPMLARLGYEDEIPRSPALMRLFDTALKSPLVIKAMGTANHTLRRLRGSKPKARGNWPAPMKETTDE